MKKSIFTILFQFFLVFAIYAQTEVSIPQIQGDGSVSPYLQQKIKTTGIVTAKFIGSNTINGFFMQDETGDNNPNTSDGIFVYYQTDNIAVGDKITLTAKVSEYYQRTQLASISNLKVISQNNTVPPTKIVYNIHNWNWEKYEGMLVEFDQTLWVNDNSNLQKDGQLELGIKRKKSPTNFALPGSNSYTTLVNENSLLPIILDDGYTSQYKSPIVFADENGTRRTGERIDNLRAVIDFSRSQYKIYPTELSLKFYGNPRPTAPKDLGDYNLKVCAFNLKYYLTQSFGKGFGPANQTESEKQHTKIIEALKAIDADIYGLVEIEQGQDALRKITQSLTAATGHIYDFVNDKGNINKSYTKVAYIYRMDKTSPFKTIKNNNSPTPRHRKKLQGFTLNSNGKRFIFSLNHFKSKSGCHNAHGLNKDQGDGQGCYNESRLKEAKSTKNFITTNETYFEDEDALIMGDLNAYAMEDPIRYFTDNGYTDLLAKYEADTAYSYVYKGQIGYLDHALANNSMEKQVTGATVFHINSDEPAMFEYSGSAYQPNMYRSSDHDPVIVGLKLGKDIPSAIDAFEQRVRIYPTYTDDRLNIEKAAGCHVQLFTLNGFKLIQKQIDSDNYTLSLSQLNIGAGVYILRVLGENIIIQQKIIVK